MADLFDTPDGAPASGGATQPLADRLRPRALSEVVGQDHLLGPDGALTRLAVNPTSTILWGPPGVGKTTLARLLAGESGLRFEQVSAIFSGVTELRKIFASAEARRANGAGTLLFVDEIHRFNRAQQDAFLPHMESGLITLIGATTENPSFALNGALLSRAQVLVLHRLDTAALEALMARAEATLGALPLDASGRAAVLAMADGDGRALLNLVERVAALDGGPHDAAAVSRLLTRRAPLHDRAGDGHYNLISALHKAVRGSDPDAALYWLSRMLDAGDDPLFLARRLSRMAVEDIGLADPQAMAQTVAARQVYEQLGSPEGELALAQATVYLALAPKSNALYKAMGAAGKHARATGALPPPAHILNAPTSLMREMGYGEGYAYDHDAPDAFSGQDYWPEGTEAQSFYQPVERGFERELAKRLAWFARTRATRRREG
jgi:putative ATPase